jgi:hypothetical protein
VFVQGELMMLKFRGTAFAGLLAVIALVGCDRHDQQQPQHAAVPVPKSPARKPAPPTPIDVKRAELGGPMWDPAWDKIVELAIPHDLLTPEIGHQVRRFCPRFAAMPEADKRAFWAYFFQALAGAEGGLKTTAVVRHSQPEMQVKDSVSGTTGRTQGLLQLTYEDQKRYGCDFDFEADHRLPVKDPGRTILRPKNNLECGIQILEQELIGQHKPLLARTQYWSTLQPGTVSFRVFAKQMTNVPAACGLRTKAHKLPQRQEELAAVANAPKP